MGIAIKGWILTLLLTSAVCAPAAVAFPDPSPRKEATAKTSNPLKGWTRKEGKTFYSYRPRFGTLAPKKKKGFFDVILFKQVPLNGKPLVPFLDDFMKTQESDFKGMKVRSRESARLVGRHRAWGYLRVRNQIGTNLNISFTAFRTGKDSVRVIREAITDNYTRRSEYKRGLLELYAYVARNTNARYRAKDRNKGAFNAVHTALHRVRTETSDQRRTRSNSERKTRRARHLASISTKPGKGLKPSQIDSIYRHLALEITAYGGQGREVVWLLLKDGTAYKGPTVPPADFNVAASRKIEPKKWYRWTRKGKTTWVRRGSGKWRKVEGSVNRPGRKRHIAFKGHRLSSWNIVGVGGGSSSAWITLKSNGRFETSSSSFVGGSSFSSPNASVSRSEDKSGEYVTSSGSAMPVLLNRSRKTNKRGSDKTGDYAIKGYTIEMLTDSGKLSRKLFMIPYQGTVAIGGIVYSKPE